MIGRFAWALDPVIEAFDGSIERRAEVYGNIGEWTAAFEHRALAAILQAAGVPAAPVLQPREMLDDPQLAHRSFYRNIPGTSARTISPAWRFAFTPLRVSTPPPEFGEHNDAVLRGLLHLDGAFIASLEARDIVRFGMS